jgi:cytochrome c2
MTLFFIKSILAFGTVILACISMVTMLEVIGKKSRGNNTIKAITMHRWSGIIYFVIFFVVTYYCLEYIVSSRAELTARSTLHGTSAALIVVLMGIKLLFIKRYREFYSSIKYIGILMVVLTFVMTFTSGGYYMLVSKFGTDKTFDKSVQYKKADGRVLIKTDLESVMRGNKLFNAKCIFCHDSDDSTKKVGPGLKGILKNDLLPVSGIPANPANVINQLRKPFKSMPSFDYLSDEQVADIIAYLNTL